MPNSDTDDAAMTPSIAESPQTQATSSALDSDFEARLSLLTSPMSTPAELYDYDDPLIASPDFTPSPSPRPRPHPRPHLHLRQGKPPNPRRVIALMYLLDFLTILGGTMLALPLLRLIEQIICRHYYNGLKGDRHIGFEDKLDEGMCKGTEVQEKLNVLLAVSWFITTIPPLLTSVPYGLLADRIGRRPVYLTALIGMMMSAFYTFTILKFWRVFPIQLIWLSPIFHLIGGGERVTSMMFFAIMNDVTTDANRSSMFLYAACAALVAMFIAPSLSSALMARSPWIPIFLGLFLFALGTCVLFLIPETLELKQDPSQDWPASSSSSRNAPKPQSKQSYISALKVQIRQGIKSFKDGASILRSFPVALLLMTFVQGPFLGAAGELAPRYISNRYSLPLHQIGYLLSIRVLVNLLLVAGILPLVSHYLTSRFAYTSKSKDLFLAELSVVLLVIGQALTAFGPTLSVGVVGMVIWTLGMGFGAFTRSLITTLVEKDQVGKLYAVIAVVEIVCAMAAGPVQAALYGVGMKWRGVWQGLPFFMLAGMSALAGVAVYIFGYLMRGKFAEGEIRLGDGPGGIGGYNEEGEGYRADYVALETEDREGVTRRAV